MNDVREVNFLRMERLSRYFCMKLHAALVNTMVNGYLLSPDSPYRFQLNHIKYSENVSELCQLHLMLIRDFTDSNPNMKQPAQLNEHEVARKSILTATASIELSILVYIMLILLLMFDLSLPDMFVDVEVGGTITKIRLLNVCISSMNLDFTTMLTLRPLRAFNILSRSDLSVTVNGFDLRCTSIKGNVQTNLRELWNLLQNRYSALCYSYLDVPIEYDTRKQASCVVQALTVHTDVVALTVDPLRFPASLYLILKDVLAENTLCNVHKDSTSNKCRGFSGLSKPCAHIECTDESFLIPALLLTARKVHVTVTHLVPSLVHCLQSREVQYQRAACPVLKGQYQYHSSQRGDGSLPAGERVEHVFSVSECFVHSCSTPLSTAPSSQHRELLLSVHHYQAIIVAQHYGAKPKVVELSMKAGDFYVRPSHSSDGGAPEQVDPVGMVTQSSLALIVYSEFASVFV